MIIYNESKLIELAMTDGEVEERGKDITFTSYQHQAGVIFIW